MRVFCAAALYLSLCLGCAPDADNQDSVEKLKTASGLCSATKEAFCARAIRLGVYSSRLTCELAWNGNGPAACKDDAERKLELDGDTLVIDFDALDRCLGEQTVAPAALASEACVSAFVGRVADGETCELDDECVSGRCGGFCSGPRTCEPALLEGTVCENTGECADGLFCGGDRGAQATCRPPQGAGAACGTSLRCGADLVCQTGTCVAAATLTAHCGAHGVPRCVVGDRACHDFGDQTDVCTAELRAVLSVGDDCGEPVEVSSSVTLYRICPQDLQCLAGQCQPYPGENERCARVSWWGEESSVCRGGLLCGADDLCHEAITRGEACTGTCDEGECLDGYCVRPAFQCAAPPPT